MNKFIFRKNHSLADIDSIRRTGLTTEQLNNMHLAVRDCYLEEGRNALLARRQEAYKAGEVRIKDDY